jgi:hypothetical protein
MKRTFQVLITIALVFGVLLWFSACEKDEGPSLTGDKTEYVLNAVSDNSISGTVTFTRRSDNAVVIKIDLNGTQSGNSHPAHIHANSAAEGGSIVLDLTDVDGATGESETIVTTLNDASPITYAELIDFDGYINVHNSSSDLATLVAQGDVGQNKLTGESESYVLNEFGDSGVSGMVTFAERMNGETLVTIELDGTTSGNSHPSHIHNNNATQGGGIAIDLTNVNGATGLSKTNVTMNNESQPLTYDDMVVFNGYVNVHLSSENLAVTIARGNIGANAQ